MAAKHGVFRSAINGSNGEVDPGYLAIYWVMLATVGSVPLVVLFAGVASWFAPSEAGATIQGAGLAIGAICTGCGAVIGAVGLFRAGDKEKGGER